MAVHPEHLRDLYRFAWILVLREDVATRLVCDAVHEVHGRSGSHDDVERQHARAFQAVRQRALKVAGAVPKRGGAGGAGWPGDAARVVGQADWRSLSGALHRVAEPGRSALALLLIDAVEPESIERLLGLPLPQLAQTLDQARADLANQLKSGASA